MLVILLSAAHSSGIDAFPQRVGMNDQIQRKGGESQILCKTLSPIRSPTRYDDFSI